MKNSTFLQGVHYLKNATHRERPLIFALCKVSNVDWRILENKNALQMPITTLDVFAYTLDEIFQTEYEYSSTFNNSYYFGMSVNDDILYYELTEQIVKKHLPK